MFILCLEDLCLLVKENLGLSRYVRVAARQFGRYCRRKSFCTGERIRGFDLGLFVLIPKHSANQPFSHSRLLLLDLRLWSSTRLALANASFSVLVSVWLGADIGRLLPEYPWIQ